MKRSLIRGAILTMMCLHIFFAAYCATNEDMNTDGQIVQICAYNDEIPALPEIKENDKSNDVFEKEEEDTYITYYTENDVIMLAKLLYNECRGVESVTEQACVAWTVLNRVDVENGESIADVITAKNQFAYSDAPLWDNLLWLSEDVLSRWNAELNKETLVGRVLPADYKWFGGDSKRNYFRNAYNGSYNIWDYSLPSPYES